MPLKTITTITADAYNVIVILFMTAWEICLRTQLITIITITIADAAEDSKYYSGGLTSAAFVYINLQTYCTFTS